MNIDDVIIQKAVKGRYQGNEHFKLIISELYIENLQITNSKMSQQNDFFAISHLSRLVIDHFNVNDTEFKHTIFSTFPRAILSLSNIQMHRIRCLGHMVYSIASTVNMKHAKIVNSTLESPDQSEPSIFRFFSQTRVEFDQVQFNYINISAKALIESRANSHLEMKNTHVPKTTMFLNSQGKLSIESLHIGASTLEFAFHITDSSV